MMNKIKILEQLSSLLEVRVDCLSDDFKLHETANWDSLTIISMLGVIDECCGVLLASGDLSACQTVGELNGLVSRTSKEKGVRC